jgi:hypothetical protein
LVISTAYLTTSVHAFQTGRSAISMPWESRCARSFNAATAASFNQDCVFAPGLESKLFRDPPQNPFSTASTQCAPCPIIGTGREFGGISPRAVQGHSRAIASRRRLYPFALLLQVSSSQVCCEDAKAPGRGPPGPSMALAGPFWAEGGVGAFGRRRKNYRISGSFDPLRRKSLYRDCVGRRRDVAPCAVSHGRLRSCDCLHRQRMRHLFDLIRWIVAGVASIPMSHIR